MKNLLAYVSELKSKVLSAFSMNGSIIALIVSLIGLVFFFKNKADKSGADAILGEVKGEDKVLKEQENDLMNKIEDVKNRDDSKLTDAERAARWGK